MSKDKKVVKTLLKKVIKEIIQKLYKKYCKALSPPRPTNKFGKRTPKTPLSFCYKRLKDILLATPVLDLFSHEICTENPT